MWMLPLLIVLVCFIVLALIWLGKPENGRWWCLALLLCALAACERIPSLYELCATKCNGDERIAHFKPRTVDGTASECDCVTTPEARWR